MAETLFDENIGGPYGNTHLAVGRSYNDTYAGSTVNVSKSVFKKLGYNDSAIHVDMISTTDRTVTATLANGKKILIYKNGRFTIWSQSWHCRWPRARQLRVISLGSVFFHQVFWVAEVYQDWAGS